MSQIPELEIELEPWRRKTYSVNLRFSSLELDVDPICKQGGLRIKFAELRRNAQDIDAYGRLLGASFFAVPGVREFFKLADAVDGPLRVRLMIDRAAPELDALRWEALRDPAEPEPSTPLFISERVRFSRFVESPDWRRPVRRPKADTRALVVVANPSDLGEWAPNGTPLAPIDVPAEVARARTGLAGVEVTVLGGGERASSENAAGIRADLDTIADKLASGFDILYLVCHGALLDKQSKLYLEDEEGKTAAVDGSALVAALKGLEPPPRLVVLVACQTAGTGEGDALGALGPTLGEAGIAAVLAMHGDVKMATVEQFMPVFFRELQQHGEIDRAVAIARGKVQHRADSWAPVLYMRLRSGSLWNLGFGGNGAGTGYGKWQSLVNSIAVGECTAILGRGMADSLVGSRRETALRLARDYRFPLAPYERDNLAQVSQFVMQDQGRPNLITELRKIFRDELIKRLGADGPAAQDQPGTAELDPLVLELGRRRWEHDPDEPHLVLARLPLRLYVTTAFDGLMAEALRYVGKHPREELFRWNEFADWGPPLSRTEPDYEPTVDEPLVYHLAGRLGKPQTLVITEDDYFDYLIGVTQKLLDVDAIPGVVTTAFVQTTLLFLGFDMGGGHFRALFRKLMNQGGKAHNWGYVHAGVQIDLEEGRAIEIDRARKYLEDYFNNDRISIYWGGVEDFVRELRQQPGLRP